MDVWKPKKRGFQDEDCPFCSYPQESEKKKKHSMKTSEFEPRVRSDGLFTPISVVIEKLLPCFDVSRSHQD